MTIQTTQDWIVINHTIKWLDEDWEETNLESREYRWSKTIEEATQIANDYLEGRGIEEGIVVLPND